MPAGDGTGPMGMGPMTGRAAGYCAGYGMPGHMNPRGGRGFGGRGGGGRGFRHRFFATGLPGWARAGYGPYAAPYAPPAWAGYAPPSAANELDGLRAHAEQMGQALDDIQKRIAEIEAAENDD